MGEHSDRDLQRRQLIERVLDRIAADPEFRKRLLDDPQAALRDAGFAREIEALLTSGEAEGYASSPADESLDGLSLPHTYGESKSILGTQLLFAAFAVMLLQDRPATDLPASKPDIDRSKVIDYTRLREMG